jgi:hypothetical protein
MKSYEHENIICDECKAAPIRTDRFKCSVCPEYDLCLYCYCRGVHNKNHKVLVLGALGILIVNESDVASIQKRGHILKKEIFFKNIGEDLELTVHPCKM